VTTDDASGRPAGHCRIPEDAPLSLNTRSFDAPLTNIAAAARGAGFDGLEIWTDDLSGGLSVADIVNLMRESALEVSAFQLLRDHEGAPSKARAHLLETAERLMAEAAAIGARTVLLCANTAPDASADRRQIEADLRVLADMAGHRRLRIGFEPLAWSRHINTYPLALACVTQVDHPCLGLTIDAFHWFWAGTRLGFAQSIPIEKCFELQLCDARPDGSPAVQLARHHRLFPGEGIWPVGALADAFFSRGFDGFVNLEVFNDSLRQLSADDFARRALRSVGRAP
jgi:4-hydroxyphenylpyruvate dioxygenase